MNTIFFYGPVGAGGITADDFRRQLSAFGKDEVLLRINSPGGDVFEGLAIASLIKAHGHVTVIVDGLAASAASFIAIAAKKVSIAKDAMLMLHAASSEIGGTAEDLREQAELLDKVSGQIADIYARRTGKPANEITAWFAQGDRWFTAEEAKGAGLVDEILDEKAKTFAHAWRFATAPAAVAARLDPVIELQAQISGLRKELQDARLGAATARVDAEFAGATVSNEAKSAIAKTMITDEAGALSLIKALKTVPKRRGCDPVNSARGDTSSTEVGYSAYLKKLSNRR